MLFQVVHCKVSDFLEGPQTSAIFPFKLKGKFEKLTDLSSSFKTRDLFKQDLPISIRLKNSDPAIGFDPLATKERLMVVKIITGDKKGCYYLYFIFILLSRESDQSATASSRRRCRPSVYHTQMGEPR